MPVSELEQFIASNIQTVEEVEILSLLSRSPETFWSTDAIAQHLGLKPDLVAARTRDLQRRRLVKGGDSGPVFRYGPADENLRLMVERLIVEYRERRIGVINAIYSANLTRLRSFADSFKLGGGNS